jgi:hypothetical protein
MELATTENITQQKANTVVVFTTSQSKETHLNIK